MRLSGLAEFHVGEGRVVKSGCPQSDHAHGAKGGSGGSFQKNGVGRGRAHSVSSINIIKTWTEQAHSH